MLELPSQPPPPQLDHNEKSCVLGPLSPYDRHQIPAKIHSTAEASTRIDTPLDGPSYTNQQYGWGFPDLPALESPPSCSGSSVASYSERSSFKGGLDRGTGRDLHGCSCYSGHDVLGGGERHYYEVEKQSFSTSDHREPTSRGRPAAATYSQSARADENSDPEDHALWILIYLSLLSPILSVLISLYALFAILPLVLLSPFYVYTTSAGFSSRLVRYLAPPVDTQLGLICSPIVPTSHKPSMLMLINLLSPIYALGIAISAWVAAAFWCYAAILGDPDGRDSKNDGVVAVMGVRWWWEVWLKRAVR